MGLEKLFGRTDKKKNVMYIPEAAPVQWRHEWKYELDLSQAAAIRSRIQAVMEPDTNAGESGRYLIRSLYFDNWSGGALHRNLAGVSPREKFRFRFYNGDTSFIRLEKKVKRNNLGTKYEERVSQAEVRRILFGHTSWLPGGQQDGEGERIRGRSMKEEEREALEHPLLLELYSKMRMSNLVPMVIVEYMREPFCFDAGNVRVTFDYDLRVGLEVEEFLNPSYMPLSAERPYGRHQEFTDCAFGWEEAEGKTRRSRAAWMQNRGCPVHILMLRGSITGTESMIPEFLPVSTGPIIMEVKWDHFLPDIIRDAVQMPGLPSQAFSKYVQCRAFG